ncbi:hypothetical protein RRG08_020534 [Elysia crispata]|uniref:Dermatopontin n=1 Tax=Elysia crispata TaxID=231223 RepID=A0AAE0Z6V4_9GAST|nr:hypothetical protein RRG08_020534 [Elysia crispata]
MACADDFNTDYDETFTFECPARQMLSSIFSTHSNYYEDRRFKFGCTSAPNDALSTTCRWSNWVNQFERSIDYICPPEWALTGVYSYHSRINEDRRMNFKCCQINAYKLADCEMTPYLNDFDDDMNYRVPQGQVLVGWFSFHDDFTEDRRHKMMACSLRQ